MPLIRLLSPDLKTKALISATNLDQIKQRGEQKLGYKIDQLLKENDGTEIYDDYVLEDFFATEKDLTLIACGDQKTKVGFKVSTSRGNGPRIIEAKSLDSLTRLTEREFGQKIEKFVRKSDFLEVDDDEILLELSNYDDNWLVAIEADSKADALGEGADDSGFFGGELKKLMDEMKIIKSTTRPTGTASNMATSELNRELDKKQKEIEKSKIEKDKKLEKINKLRTMNTELARQREEIKGLEKKYQDKLFRDETTVIAGKTEIQELEARLVELELRKKTISNIFKDLADAEKVDICFMVDATGSMASYINEAKTVVHRVADRLKKKFTEFDLRTAFIGYRDHTDGADRVTVFPFTENIDSFKTFVSSVKATGGDDECEDIFGGLEEVNKLSWSNMSRILLHIGDAPCHGRRFHLDCGDTYPSGDPRGLNINNLLKGLAEKNINYYFAEINNSTVKMIDEFSNELISINGKKINVLKLAGVEGLTEIVTTSVMKTITASKSLSMHSMRGKKMRIIDVDRSFLTWSKDRLKTFTSVLYRAQFHGGVEDIRHQTIEFKKENVEIQIAEKPFAKGAIRYAYAGLLNGTKKCVFKKSASLDPEHNTMKFYKEMIETQVIACVLAKKFFDIMRTDKKVSFLEVSLIHVDETGEYFTVEDFVSGEFVKWINNCGVLNEDIYSCTLDAFSHWSYQATGEYLIVNDLQGISVDNKEYILTDPAISSPEGYNRFSTTNLALKGIKKFFQTHQCNHVCNHLRLKKHKYQTLPDRVKHSMMTKISI